MMKTERPLLIAEPLAERKWQVIAGAWDRPSGGRVLGFINELGGVYEVAIINQPELSQFFNTFKEAVDYFSALSQTATAPVTHRAGAA
ncbi:MAG: hypothetical protein ABIW32_06230 [Terrimesophilobacter sp.]